MGKLISAFTFDRNTLKKDAIASGQAVVEHIDLVASGRQLDKRSSNIVGALANYMGVFVKNGAGWTASATAKSFREIYNQNKEDAFCWLLTRSLWRYQVPNGTACSANQIVRKDGRFNFFHKIIVLLCRLSAHPGAERFLFFEELCELLNDDDAWYGNDVELYGSLIKRRKAKGIPANPRKLLEDLEEKYKVGRDNLNGVLVKAFRQTGLFEYSKNRGSEVAIALAGKLDAVLQRRIRFILDHPAVWVSGENTWSEFLSSHKNDMPVEAAAVGAPLEQSTGEELSAEGIVDAVSQAFQAANFRIHKTLIHRFLASLLTKKFVILTGLSGSGKTRVGQAFALWMCGPNGDNSRAVWGGREIPSDRITYHVHRSDSLSIEIWNGKEEEGATKVVLPWEMIGEWAKCIRENEFTKKTPSKEIREAVQKTSKFSNQLHSFDTILKAVAFEYLDCPVGGGKSRVIAVGADWTSNENLFGYRDALDSSRYVKTDALDLVMSAAGNRSKPHILILDEMNLSHVERYFASALSSIESGEPICLYSKLPGDKELPGGVPASISLPENLFVLGTVNVDETTYMFSPKVLDRANVIEFRSAVNDVVEYSQNAEEVGMAGLAGKGASYAEIFVALASSHVKLQAPYNNWLKAELELLLEILVAHESEFGFRVAKEMARFIRFYVLLAGEPEDPEEQKRLFGEAMDAQIMQKILPKLHGAQRKLGPILKSLAAICYVAHQEGANQRQELVARANRAGEDDWAEDDPMHEGEQFVHIKLLNNGLDPKPHYPISYEKIIRMLRRLRLDGFAGFAEA